MSNPTWEYTHEHQSRLIEQDGWMCEQHPGVEFPHGDCAGPGQAWIIEGKKQVQALAARHSDEGEAQVRAIVDAVFRSVAKDDEGDIWLDVPRATLRVKKILQGELPPADSKAFAHYELEIAESLAAPSAVPGENKRDPQTALNDAVMYALKVGCFFPVPEPQPGASTDELVKWGAMRHLHDAIARFNRCDFSRPAS